MTIKSILINGLICTCFAVHAEVKFRSGESRVDVVIDGHPFTTFHYGDQWDKPFFQPLRSPSHTVITRSFPLEKVEGETSDHVWQRGLLLAHGDINGVDFWRELGRDKTGRTICTAPVTKAGKTLGTLRADCQLVPPTGGPLGTVIQSYGFQCAPGRCFIDVTVTVAADKGVPLKMGDTEEGTMALRLADEFREDHGASLTNSEGLSGTSNIWGKRARWVDYSTKIKGELVGAAILDHPSNPKHPTYWHARGYGLLSANPFGEHDFLKDKTRDGSITIPAGDKLTFRYRVVIHAGSAESAGIEQLYAAFAHSK
jgi:hypothetical protein